MLDAEKIEELEALHGRHNFCYQCGSPDIAPIEEPYAKGLFHCPKCGSSDLDE